MDRLRITATFDIENTEFSTIPEVNIHHAERWIYLAIRDRFSTYKIGSLSVTAKGYNSDGSCDMCNIDAVTDLTVKRYIHNTYHVDRL